MTATDPERSSIDRFQGITMTIDASLLGQIILVSFMAAAVGTFWYSRRPDARNTVGALVVACAWIVPLIGPTFLLIYLAALPKVSAKQVSESNTD
jgi:hypothetical protein